ncbi:DNA-directed RNA polymerase subunit RPC12/RpoP [Pantoea alhagi]|nr:DNA-directed RNA polymerase subunit RPC12/RpoP [Pantoea alhagi]
MVMKIRCTACGSKRFRYTTGDQKGKFHHGAVCAYCFKPFTVQDVLPNTEVDPIARCLIGQRNNRLAP